MASFNLSNSVGEEGANDPDDVLAVKARLADLGFPVPRNSASDSNTISIIRLFQSIIKGELRVLGDGRVDKDGPTHKYLQAVNAPRWMQMPDGSPTDGFINHDKLQGDNHDFGTSWMIETIQAAGQLYLTNYRTTHPGSALIQTNNLSLPRGGNTPMHSTHETGLSCDIRVPRKDGDAGTTVSDPEYDREAMRAMLKAIRGQRKHGIKRIYFNDFTLIAEGLCRELPGHHNHAHVDIVAPLRGGS
jgi:hypothetical protein